MKTYDLYAIGNALVDSEYEVSDTQLQSMGVDKGHMTLIDTTRRTALQSALHTTAPRRTGGGSAGNTVVALAQLGGLAFYSCRVADDEFGAFYAQDLLANGVSTNLATTKAPPGQTGTCMVLVTPDAQRSMSTFLGATADLDESALVPQAIEGAKVYYMEGYLAASPTGLAAALKGRQIAKDAGVALATTLSDVSMINFCKPGLDAIVGQDLQYLFCNEEEAQVWCGTHDMAVICKRLSALAQVVCLTRGPLGCIVLEGHAQTAVPAASIKALDSNGAGDMFAGSFLYATAQGHTHAQAAWLANQAAGRVVSQYGNRLTSEVIAGIKARFAQHLAA
jgi:sugar/nucleoside kinase (ribokinase family)